MDIDLEKGDGYSTHEASTAMFRNIYNTVKAYDSSKLMNICLPGMTSVNGSVGGENWCVYADLNNYCDTASIMSYGMAWAGSAPGPVSPRSWLEGIYDYASQVMDTEKVFLGMPAYGWNWQIYDKPENIGKYYRGTSQTYMLSNEKYKGDALLQKEFRKDNPYFDVTLEKGKNQVILSSAMAQKYGISAGDDVVLKDEENDRKYAFTVKEIVPYAAGFYAFMDIESMRELMGESEDYYNIVFADHALDIDSARLYATTSKAEIKKSASVFVELMWPMIFMLCIVSALIFIVVMYLMLKVMVDRSAMSISMMKIFGYRKKEIRRLFLNGNLVIVAVSALYFIINPLLMRRVNNILPAEILKNRE